MGCRPWARGPPQPGLVVLPGHTQEGSTKGPSRTLEPRSPPSLLVLCSCCTKDPSWTRGPGRPWALAGGTGGRCGSCLVLRSGSRDSGSRNHRGQDAHAVVHPSRRLGPERSEWGLWSQLPLAAQDRRRTCGSGSPSEAKSHGHAVCGPQAWQVHRGLRGSGWRGPACGAVQQHVGSVPGAQCQPLDTWRAR